MWKETTDHAKVRAMRLVTEQPNGSRLGDFLCTGLTSNASSFRGAVAFLKASGLSHLQPFIHDFSATRPFELIVGIDLQGTSIEGLQMLLDALGEQGRAFVFHNPGSSTFHPKVYRFTYADRTEVYVGSGNITSGGLFTNHEAGVHLTVKDDTPGGEDLLHQLDETLDRWSVDAGASARLLDAELITALTVRGLIANEATMRVATAVSARTVADTLDNQVRHAALFAGVTVPAAPAPSVELPAVTNAAVLSVQGATRSTYEAASPSRTDTTTSDVTTATPTVAIGPGVPRFFVMTLQNTDVGSGQVSANTARRSPEVFIPLAARDQELDFWKWPYAFEEDPTRPGKMDRPGVQFLVNGRPVDVHIWYNPVKRDVRLRNEDLRSAGEIGDILQLERSGAPGVEYVATIIPMGSAGHADMLARCDHPVRNSRKRFGYF